MSQSTIPVTVFGFCAKMSFSELGWNFLNLILVISRSKLERSIGCVENMGVNATGTVGGRRSSAVGGEGGGVWGRAVPPLKKL